MEYAATGSDAIVETLSSIIYITFLGAKIGRIIENCKNLTIFLYLSQMALMTQIFIIVPQKLQKWQKVNKNQKNTFRCLELLQSSSAKWSVFVFESKLSGQIHTSYHITIVITNIKKKKHRFFEPKKLNFRLFLMFLP